MCIRDRLYTALREWRTHIGDGGLFFTLYDVQHPDRYGLPADYQYRMVVESTADPLGRSALFAATYRCAAFLDDVLAYDPGAGTVFHSVAEFWEFASLAIKRWPKLPGRLRKARLLGEDGILALDRPAPE